MIMIMVVNRIMLIIIIPAILIIMLIIIIIVRQAFLHMLGGSVYLPVGHSGTCCRYFEPPLVPLKGDGL